jgi:spoIIIJ-associated protein
MNSDLNASLQFAKKFAEDTLSFFGLNLDVAVSAVDDEIIEVKIPSSGLNGFLIGQRGENMQALQFLLSSALKNNGYTYMRVSVDVADYKLQRAERLKQKAEDWVTKVKETGEPMELRNMNAADRRTIHQLAAEYGLVSQSVGEGRGRHIVLSAAE